jgi:hypothetical protein
MTEHNPTTAAAQIKKARRSDRLLRGFREIARESKGALTEQQARRRLEQGQLPGAFRDGTTWAIRASALETALRSNRASYATAMFTSIAAFATFAVEDNPDSDKIKGVLGEGGDFELRVRFGGKRVKAELRLIRGDDTDLGPIVVLNGIPRAMN